MRIAHAVNIYCVTKDRDTRQILLEAAAEEFARHGLDGARMHVIVERAGINERMIYHHFGSKVGLYEAVLASYMQPPEAFAADAEASGPRDAFVAILTRFVRRLVARPQFLSLMLHEAMTGWTHVPEASLADIPQELRRPFEAARRAGEFRKDCRFEVVYLAAIGAMVSGQLLAGRFLDVRSEKARDKLAADLLDLVLRGATP
jgi:AcrR family transcriptional regulator